MRPGPLATGILLSALAASSYAFSMMLLICLDSLSGTFLRRLQQIVLHTPYSLHHQSFCQ